MSRESLDVLAATVCIRVLWRNEAQVCRRVQVRTCVATVSALHVSGSDGKSGGWTGIERESKKCPKI